MRKEKSDGEQANILKGSLVFAFGLGAAVIFQFGVGVLVVRNLSKSEFGMISLSMTILNLLATFCCMGFNNGIPRIIASHSGLESKANVNNIVSTALVAVAIISLSFTLLLFLCAEPIAAFLSTPELQNVLRPFSLMIFPMTMMLVCTAIFRGIGAAKPKVIFQDFILNMVRIVMLVPVLVLGWGANPIVWVYILSTWITFFAYLRYAFVRVLKECKFTPSKKVLREILWFSLPLLPVAVLTNFSDWAATLSLGYFYDAKMVGVYSVARRLVSFMSIPLMAVAFLYLPMATKLKVTDDNVGIMQLYANSTKWIFVFTMPLFFIFLFDGSFLVSWIFGPAYAESAPALKILAIGFGIFNMAGPCGMTLIAKGQTRSVLYSTIISAACMLFCCGFMVPIYGEAGAAVGISVSISASNLFMLVILYREQGIHPLGLNNIKPILLTGGGTYCISIWCFNSVNGGGICSFSGLCIRCRPFCFVPSANRQFGKRGKKIFSHEI